ncbi:hypothetical protein RFI_31278 [Reticulomyxa filosa]|uniref:Uncharacterized protein n=1 Tax=Reticulomyxa filosa TaxID=46433 RepID=X6LY80_RETFI|nr:hypothetical protein RFI_31278 [Reticulomyxa filosa]|eukprot:ETO06117.1 hypothetical protein RFI_31278 [Reticulomyxa filosa]
MATTDQIFQTLKELTIQLIKSQCVLHKHGIIICYVILWGHCVVKLIYNNKDINQITLLCFGGHYKHTLLMKYISVWDNVSKANHQNELITLTDNNNSIINIEKDYNNYHVMLAVLGGVNNNLLFINYYPHYINNNLPTKDNETIFDHCLIKISYEEMLFFYSKSSILIKYDEYSNQFYFNHIKIYDQLSKSGHYGYVYVDSMVLLFGECSDITSTK